MVPAASRKAAPIQADPPCHAPSHVVPIHEYNHDSGSCAVTGDLVEQRVALAAGGGHILQLLLGAYLDVELEPHDGIAGEVIDRTTSCPSQA